MTSVGRQLDGRADLVADHVDGVEVLREPDEVAVVAIVAGSASAHAVMDVGRSGDQAEDQVVAAERDGMCGIARRQRELAGTVASARFSTVSSIRTVPVASSVSAP